MKSLTEAQESSNSLINKILWATIISMVVLIWVIGSMGVFSMFAGLAFTLSIGVLFIRAYSSGNRGVRWVFKQVNKHPFAMDAILTIAGFLLFGATGGPIGYFIGACFGLFSSFMVNWLTRNLEPIREDERAIVVQFRKV